MSSAGESGIVVQDLSHAYGGERVLDRVDWTLEPGDRWVLLGASGAGKTTLAEIIAGLTQPNRGGTILRDGDDSPNLAEWRRGVSWLSTDLLDRIPGHQTVLDTVVAGKHSQTLKAERSGLSYSRNDDTRAGELLERVGLDAKQQQCFGDLSQGESQLSLVARSLMGDPELMILDEPCAGMDPAARERFLDEVGSFLDEHERTTVIYITHHVEEILPSFGQVLALREGRVVYCGEKRTLLEERSLEAIYGTGFKLVEDNGRYWPAGTR